MGSVALFPHFFPGRDPSISPTCRLPENGFRPRGFLPSTPTARCARRLGEASPRRLRSNRRSLSSRLFNPGAALPNSTVPVTVIFLGRNPAAAYLYGVKLPAPRAAFSRRSTGSNRSVASTTGNQGRTYEGRNTSRSAQCQRPPRQLSGTFHRRIRRALVAFNLGINGAISGYTHPCTVSAVPRTRTGPLYHRTGSTMVSSRRSHIQHRESFLCGISGGGRFRRHVLPLRRRYPDAARKRGTPSTTRTPSRFCARYDRGP